MPGNPWGHVYVFSEPGELWKQGAIEVGQAPLSTAHSVPHAHSYRQALGNKSIPPERLYLALLSPFTLIRYSECSHCLWSRRVLYLLYPWNHTGHQPWGFISASQQGWDFSGGHEMVSFVNSASSYLVTQRPEQLISAVKNKRVFPLHTQEFPAKWHYFEYYYKEFIRNTVILSHW